jgi:hypothetical protein
MEGAGSASTAYIGIGQAFKKIYTEEAGPFTPGRLLILVRV